MKTSIIQRKIIKMYWHRAVALAAGALLFLSCSSGSQPTDSVENIVQFTSYLINEINGVVKDNSIHVTLPWGTDLSSLKAVYSTTGGEVTVDGIVQFSNESLNDFTEPVVYNLTGTSGITSSYTVTVTTDTYHPDLVSLWKMDENQGVTALDSAGENNGVYHDNVSWVDGIDNSALVLNGTGYVEIHDSPEFRNTSSFSISVWIKTSEVYSFRYIMNKWWYREEDGSGVSFRSWSLNLENTNLIWRGTTNGGDSGEKRVSYDYSLHLEQWTFIAATYDGSQLKLYVNGQLAGTEILESIIETDKPIFLGAGNIGNLFYFNGLMDNAAFYGSALSDDDIEIMFGKGI